MKDIKRRIRSVESTAQITKAMELVASSKLKKAKERAIAAAPFFDTLYKTICDISSSVDDFTSVYTQKREIKNSLFIVIAGERGLAGGYNNNVFKLADASMAGKNAKVIAIGKKAVEHYQKAGTLLKGYPGIAEDIDQLRVNAIAREISNLYLDGEADEVFIYYTQFISALTQEALELKMLPLSDISEHDGHHEYVEYDPSPEVVFDSIVVQYISGMLYGAVVESYASEQGARRTAMEAANDNAQEMIDSLSLSYNRARQTAITQEITEIVSGSGV